MDGGDRGSVPAEGPPPHSAVSPSENHILEDVNKCVIALQEKDVDGLDRTAGAIRGRAARVVHVVTSEMDNYEPGVYTEKVLEATKLLSNTGGDPPPLLPTPRSRAGRIVHWVPALRLGRSWPGLSLGLKSSGGTQAWE